MRVILTRSVCTEFSRPPLPTSGDKNVPFLLVPGGHLSHESFISCFGEEKGRSECPSCPCCFLVLLAQNNPYAQVTYFGEAHSAILQYQVH